MSRFRKRVLVCSAGLLTAGSLIVGANATAAQDPPAIAAQDPPPGRVNPNIRWGKAPQCAGAPTLHMVIDYVAPPEVLPTSPPLDDRALAAARIGLKLVGIESSGPLRFESAAEKVQTRARTLCSGCGAPCTRRSSVDGRPHGRKWS